MAKQDIQYIKLNDLCLWSENPRDPIDVDAADSDIIERAVKDPNSKWNLSKMVSEMGQHYDFSELPTVVYENNKYIVYDGNKRVAVLKYLQDKNLYASFGGGLFPELEPAELRSLENIPCNVCDKETALTNIERKHVNTGSWGPLEREYFLHMHRGKAKSLFLILDEQTGIISQNPKMNQRFIKEEVLTEKKLQDIGFKLNQKGQLTSNYSNEKSADIFKKVISVVDDGKISTRGEKRGKLKEALIEEYPELDKSIEVFNNEKPSAIVEVKFKEQSKPKNSRRTPIQQQRDIIFGKKLILKSGGVNDLYRAIDLIYDQNKLREQDLKIIYPIIAMSLRLIVDLAAKEYYMVNEPTKTDKQFEDFLKLAKNEFKKQPTKEKVNYISLTTDWLSSKYNIEGILHTWAHGDLPANKSEVLKMSKIVGDILIIYFGKV